MASDASPLRRFTLATYLVAFLFVVHPFVDVVTNNWPLEPGSMEWRFGLFGVAANYLLSPLFGLALAAWIAAMNGHRGMLLLCAGTGALASLALLLGSVLYGLDVLQLQNNVRPEAEFSFRVGSMKSFFKIVTTGVVFGVVGWAAFRTARATQGDGTSGGPAVLIR